MTTNQSNEMAQVIHRARLNFSSYKAAYDAVCRLHETVCTQTSNSFGMTIKAPSGGGKTTMIEAVGENFQPIDKGTYVERPVVIFSIPPRPGIISTGMVILDAMGAHYPRNATTRDISKILLIQIINCKTRILIIDESQEMVERGTQKQHRELADWLKWLMNETKVSIVMVGLPILTRLLDSNSQLKRRFSETHSISGWNLESKASMEEFQAVLYTLIESSGYRKDCRIIEDTKFLEQLHYATNGLIAHMVTITAEAVRLSAEDRGKGLKVSHFEEAFKLKIWAEVSLDRNPFSSSFNHEPLTRFGEPFYEEG
ncbi:TniB family NTP-binding protein [Aestuariirhabdus litorea]|uniref:Transposase n=1 Tax=Aestuariirhabdus litorea TaxID=2528527 RepID=A0A3P3VIN7_9GAMM|nr:TniB family NTP-binding protein [Aestuariirhabdus litorea]RRJ82595.1 hypothetical protein D0544_12070 [Aestuariirhabdus litorea]RWW92754.1 hypothetical protein DZC74_12045 [Endozoicomonadaceae bacterium GTF-13]